MNKKKLVIGIIIGIIIVFGIFFLIKFLIGTCEDTETGWRCERVGLMEEAYKQKCENEGGRWKCYGFCLFTYPRFCDFPYEDAGKECTDSSQCDGKCIADCKENCVGECAEYPLGGCDGYYIELINGITKENLLLCD